MKQWKFLIFGMAFSLMFVIGSGIVLADKYGLDATAKAADLNTTDNLPTIVGNIIGTALSIVSVVFFILMIFAGFLWMTAHGKEDQEKKARDTIFAAIIGIIIILAAYAITNLVFSSVKAGSGGGGGGGSATPTQTASGNQTKKTDDACLDLNGECQFNATKGGNCTIGSISGKYQEDKCLSNSSRTYLCCVPTKPIGYCIKNDKICVANDSDGENCTDDMRGVNGEYGGIKFATEKECDVYYETYLEQQLN